MPERKPWRFAARETTLSSADPAVLFLTASVPGARSCQREELPACFPEQPSCCCGHQERPEPVELVDCLTEETKKSALEKVKREGGERGRQHRGSSWEGTSRRAETDVDQGFCTCSWEEKAANLIQEAAVQLPPPPRLFLEWLRLIFKGALWVPLFCPFILRSDSPGRESISQGGATQSRETE